MVDIKRTLPEHRLELELYQSVTEYISHYYDLAKQTNNQMLLLLVMLYQRILSSSSFALHDTMKRRLARSIFGMIVGYRRGHRQARVLMKIIFLYINYIV
jgi:hypothetical protein